MHQALDAIAEVDEGAEIGQAGDLAGDDSADIVVLEEDLPDVGLHLLHAEAHALGQGVQVEDLGGDAVALLHDLAGVLDLLGPAEVGNMDEAVDALFQFHEGAELRDVAHGARDDHAGLVLLGDGHPGIGGDLLHAEADATVVGIDLQDESLDLVAQVDHALGGLDLLGPAHLGDVDQAFDAGLELDKCAVVSDRDDLALDRGLQRITLLHGEPGIGELLLVAEADALGVLVVLEHGHFDLVAHLEHLAGVVEPAPRHVGDVQQAVHTAEVDEGAVLGDVLDGALDQLALFEARQGLFLQARVDGLEEQLAGQHDVAAAAVDLDDLHVEGLAEVGIQVADGLHVHLAAGQEGADADIDRQTALDLLEHGAVHGHVGTEGLLDLVPDLHLLGALAAEAHVAVGILEHLEQHFHDLAHLHTLRAVGVVELVKVDGSRTLVADVDDDVLAADFHDHATHDFLFAQAPRLTLQGGHELLAFCTLVLDICRVEHGDAAHLLGAQALDD